MWLLLHWLPFLLVTNLRWPFLSCWSIGRKCWLHWWEVIVQLSLRVKWSRLQALHWWKTKLWRLLMFVWVDTAWRFNFFRNLVELFNLELLVRFLCFEITVAKVFRIAWISDSVEFGWRLKWSCLLVEFGVGHDLVEISTLWIKTIVVLPIFLVSQYFAWTIIIYVRLHFIALSIVLLTPVRFVRVARFLTFLSCFCISRVLIVSLALSKVTTVPIDTINVRLLKVVSHIWKKKSYDKLSDLLTLFC